MPVATTSQAVREDLVTALRLDLIGPTNDHPFARELLPQSPTRWYLTGFLVPTDAKLEDRTDPTGQEEIDFGDDTDGADDAAAPDHGAARKSLLPSSIGLSVLVPGAATVLDATVEWGDYTHEGGEEKPPAEGPPDGPTPPPEASAPARGYRRIPKQGAVRIDVGGGKGKPTTYAVPGSDGLALYVTVRPVGAAVTGGQMLPAGTRSVSVFLVNRRLPDEEHPYKTFAFQTRVTLHAAEGFVARPDLRGAESSQESDERIADLQYRDVFEYAVGHAVSATAERAGDGSCNEVSTTWIPSAEVERVEPALIPGVELRMEALAELADGAAAQAAMQPLVTAYRAWIEGQRGELAGLSAGRRATATDLLTDAQGVASRIEAGIATLADPMVLEAFRIANRTMAIAGRRREAQQRQTDPASVPAPTWRPFQLAFVLMTLRGIVEPNHADRELADLLFFPTGGGKTEAYLGLAAFTMVLRRLRHPGLKSCGVSVLMRYTLRLLTLDQLGRAAALMCALELERVKNPDKLGPWPFEIGLWVGRGATPNRMGGRGDQSSGHEHTAYAKTVAFQRDDSKPSPIPIENCPWCGEKFNRNSFRLVPNITQPLDLQVGCVNMRCEFSGDRALPIVAVDEPIYRRLPAFIIATVDKFAALPWTGQTGTLFGLVERNDRHGFYGPSDPGRGTAFPGPLPPPDLIIQDELHLISGPLGTIAGVYETAIDALCSRQVGGETVRPKIVASTATVRRAQKQVRALFDRTNTAVFPPPGPDRRDTYFSITKPSTEIPARLYVGIAGQGRSLKVVLLRTALAILSAAQVAYENAGGKRNKSNPADPYMTLLGYFNSLRELGGSRRIVEDEVSNRLESYGVRKRLDPVDDLFARRKIQYEVLELTSRVSTSEVAGAKRRLARPFYEDDCVDVALATNMISVGLDIIRLGLMVVLGQPKTCAEYIQATSRVGRDPNRPGLVVTLLNIHKPRDRSHYERFETFHASFYRAVEATSVTPFSPRALDRALAASLVAMCRHGERSMTAATGASEVLQRRNDLTQFGDRMAARAANHAAGSAAEAARVGDGVRNRCMSLLDDWFTIAGDLQSKSVTLQYQREVGGAKRLLHEFLHPELANVAPVYRRFRANRSMRDVEPSVDIEIKRLHSLGGR